MTDLIICVIDGKLRLFVYELENEETTISPGFLGVILTDLNFQISV